MWYLGQSLKISEGDHPIPGFQSQGHPPSRVSSITDGMPLADKPSRKTEVLYRILKKDSFIHVFLCNLHVCLLDRRGHWREEGIRSHYSCL